jgi:hypothetical protein
MSSHPQQGAAGHQHQQAAGAGQLHPSTAPPPPQQQETTALGDKSTMTSEVSNLAVPPNAENTNIIIDVPESSKKGAQKTKGKPFCYRCHTMPYHTRVLCGSLL